MPIIYHITTSSAWDKAKLEGAYTAPSLINEGFIHCSHEDQLADVKQRYFQETTDLVLLTSDNEGTPLSLIQAGMVGIPVVATNVGSTNEIVVNGETGLLTDLSVGQLADAVSRVATDGALRAKMGSAGKEYTLARYGVKRLVKDHQDLYLRLLNR
jgi:glycosyltransferase involved in cell wall biosynthesis